MYTCLPEDKILYLLLLLSESDMAKRKVNKPMNICIILNEPELKTTNKFQEIWVFKCGENKNLCRQ